MILPNNGKVVIIDDVPKEVEALMTALTKEKMPFLFFKDPGGDDLPPRNSPVENVRLVFLDLDLGLGGITDTEMIRIVQGRLERILKKNTPYILVIWSSHEDKLLEPLIKDFNGIFSDYRPIAHCSLDKSLIRTAGSNVVEAIREKLKADLSAFESFNAFLLWESIVNKSSGEIVNDFTRIFDFNTTWDKNVKAFFFRLAKANVGPTKINSLSNEERLQLALETINSALIDSIEKNIRSEGGSLILDISETGSLITPANLVSINTKLHLLQSENLNHFNPGNIYFQDVIDEIMVSEIVKSTFEKDKIEEVLSSEILTIKVDVTPVCDYSQDKGYTRLLSGILVEGKFREKGYKKNSTAIYIYDLCPVLEINGKNYYLIFDFRYFKSLKQQFIFQFFAKPNYKLRTQLLLDLQAGLANHINRPGIVSIN